MTTQPSEKFRLHVRLVIHRNGGVEHSRRAQRFGIVRQVRVAQLTQPGVESIIGSHRSGKIPGVHQDITCQALHQPPRIQLGRRSGTHGRYVNDSVEQPPAGLERPFQPVIGQFPPHLWVIAWSVGLQPQRPQQQHVMKTDDMFQHCSGIPLIARRSATPFSVRRRNRRAESPAHRQVQFA